VSGPLVSKALAASLPGPQKLTLVALASHAGDDGTRCWPGKALLAAEVGRDVRTIQRHLKHLIFWGFISLISDTRRGRGRRDEYLIHVEKGDASVSLPQNKGRHHCRKRETPLSPKGDMGVVTSLTVKNHHEPLGVSAPTSRAPTRPTPAWDCPDWFEPLTTLKGYQRKNYSGLAKRIVETAAAYGVDHAAFIAEFASYWPRGRAAIPSWNYPTAVLNSRLDSQVKRFMNGRRVRNGQVERPDAAKTLNVELRSQVQP
jgi:hypothetical protein